MAGIAFTYDLSTAIGQARLYAGDTDPNGLSRTGGDRTRTDEEVAYLLSRTGNDARLAAASLLEGKAAEFAAQAIYVNQGSLAQDFRQRSMQLRECADALRSLAAVAIFNASSQPAQLTVGAAGTMEGW